jgi:HSP20 family protein
METNMANIARFSPFDDAFDDLFRGFLVRPVSYEGPSGAAQFRVDVSENDNAYTLRAEIPGVKKEDIQITVDGDTVAVGAEVKNEKDVKNGDRVLRSERYYGKVYRAFTLGQPVDESSALAKYSDGVLELTLPKRAAVQAKRIAIQ